jgi:hypothetical protein
MFTASCCRHLAAKGYPITLVTPGNDVAEILRVVTALAPRVRHGGAARYPPFLNGVIDAGRVRGVSWSDYRVRLVLAGEVFSEQWRDLVGQRTGGTRPCYDSASLYGTADAGVLAKEHRCRSCIRRFLAEHPDAAHELFGEPRLPTLAQYEPTSRYFETHEGTLLFTGDKVRGQRPAHHPQAAGESRRNAPPRRLAPRSGTAPPRVTGGAGDGLFLVRQIRWREHDEHLQVLGHVHQAVLLTVVHGDHAAGLELDLLVDHAQRPAPLPDDVDLVGHVRPLFVLGADGQDIQPD